MLFKLIEADQKVGDEEFDRIYPDAIRKKADTHFTPVQVAKVAARLLAPKPKMKILDIGAGAGKFCMIGSVCTQGYFVGVEQRKELCSIARTVSDRYQLSNVAFIHSNITDISFAGYDAFYFFNSFHENLCPGDRLDDQAELKKELFRQYSRYVKDQLAHMPDGTKLVTYCSFLEEVPENYVLKNALFDRHLKVWEKVGGYIR